MAIYWLFSKASSLIIYAPYLKKIQTKLLWKSSNYKQVRTHKREINLKFRDMKPICFYISDGDLKELNFLGASQGLQVSVLLWAYWSYLGSLRLKFILWWLQVFYGSIETVYYFGFYCFGLGFLNFFFCVLRFRLSLLRKTISPWIWRWKSNPSHSFCEATS